MENTTLSSPPTLDRLIDQAAERHLSLPKGEDIPATEKVRELSNELARARRKAKAQERLLASAGSALKSAASERDVEALRSGAETIEDL